MHNGQRQATITKGRGNNQEKWKREKSTERRYQRSKNLMDRLVLPGQTKHLWLLLIPFVIYLNVILATVIAISLVIKGIHYALS